MVGIEMQEFLSLPDEDLDAFLAAINDGATSPKEILEVDDRALNAFEELALGYYQNGAYQEAALVFGLALGLDPRRTACLRGLGACAQATRAYPIAMRCYELSLAEDANDLISMACLGECQCLAGNIAKGAQTLTAMCVAAGDSPALFGYVRRARAILETVAR
jgi:tetratricopeptide (TPR) repeat protein